MCAIVEEEEKGEGVMADFSDFFSKTPLIRDCFVFSEQSFRDKNRTSDPIFNAAGYTSKVFYQDIRKYIEAYTKPGAVVLDSFAGSGSTGVAALLEGRKAILVDNSPYAIYTERNLLGYVDLQVLAREYRQLLEKLEPIFNDLYETELSDGTRGCIKSVIVSDVYECGCCKREVVLLDHETGNKSEYLCTNCGNMIHTKSDQASLLEKRRPVRVRIKAV